MIVKLLTEHHLEFLSLKGGCPGTSESTNVKMPHCWKSHALAQLVFECEHCVDLIVWCNMDQALKQTKTFKSFCFNHISLHESYDTQRGLG